MTRSAAARRVVRALTLGVAVSVVVTALSRVGALGGWETRAVDAFLFLRERAPAPEIVLVVVDDEAFRELGARQPLSRRYLADLGEFLLRSGARVVAYDVVFQAPTTPGEDAALLGLARRWAAAPTGRAVFASLAIPRQAGEIPRYDAAPLFSPELRGLFGFSNALVGADGLVRRMAPLLPAGEGGYLPALSLAALAAHAGYTGETLARALGGGTGGALALPVRDARGGGARTEPIPLERLAGPPWRIDFAGPAGSVATFPSAALVRLARSGARAEADNPFRGKIVFVGATFEESREFYPTPVGRMAGVEIHANMLHTLLARRTLLPPHWAWNLAALSGACLAVALLSLWLRPLWVALASLVLVALFVRVSYEAYTRAGYWLDFVAPVVGMMAYLEGSRLLARRRLRAAFGQYVSPEVVARVEREGSRLGGEVRTASVLISDLRGFTTLAERTAPERVSETMSEYFTAMVEVIAARRGLVQDFIGDAVLAVYGVPASDPDHAWHAVRTALEMQAALARLNARWAGDGRVGLAMGVAVHTGEVFAGNVGSPRRKKYTVLGDTVNVAARLEGLNRDLGTAILISGATLGAVRDRVVVRDRGVIHVKGRSQPVAVFELQGLVEPRAEAAGR